MATNAFIEQKVYELNSEISKLAVITEENNSTLKEVSAILKNGLISKIDNINSKLSEHLSSHYVLAEQSNSTSKTINDINDNNPGKWDKLSKLQKAGIIIGILTFLMRAEVVGLISLIVGYYTGLGK